MSQNVTSIKMQGIKGRTTGRYYICLCEPVYSEKIGAMLSMKVINNKYLLKNFD